MSASRKPSHGRSRIRNAAQLERKRILDREHQRLRRQKAKRLSETIQAEMSDLRQGLTFALERLDRLCQLVESHEVPDLFNGKPAIAPMEGMTSRSKASFPMRMISGEVQIPPDHFAPTHTHRPGGFPVDSHRLDEGKGLYQPFCTASTDAPICECFCGIQHQSITECTDFHTIQLLLKAHIAIQNTPAAAQLYPRTPKIENLLLLEHSLNPVVEILGPMMKRGSPSSLADTIAIYLIMYRLLRWRVYPIPETFQDVPPWYRPSKLQRTQPHPICIDFLAWPGLRENLILNFDSLDKLSFSRLTTTAITVHWPGNRDAIVKDKEGDWALNPQFENHIYTYSNWKLKRGWADRFPHLVHLVNISEE
ncbi:hypothetical protein AARAC_007444 [Aspergillus arachidicola]|uniref:BZIP domain-containing protein n=1 Tax=Aspergillus arachidicola TaxID=656916 RepID=A0A2G7G3L5_9EURO|nr:hypothetical protein AARAC_007444 [Aspergillus arachidicola]